MRQQNFCCIIFSERFESSRKVRKFSQTYVLERSRHQSSFFFPPLFRIVCSILVSLICRLTSSKVGATVFFSFLQNRWSESLELFQGIWWRDIRLDHHVIYNRCLYRRGIDDLVSNFVLLRSILIIRIVL